MDKQLGSITEEATKALRQIAAKKKAKEALEQLRWELASAEQEIGTDPATPESLQSLGQQIRDTEAEMAAIPEDQRQSENYKLAERALDLLKQEWNAQDHKLEIDKMLTSLIRSVIAVREILNDGQRLIDAGEGDIRIARKFFAFYSASLTPALSQCVDTTLGEFLELPAGKA
jgi:hypothetical protein